MFSENEGIIYSGLILKEMKFKLNDDQLFNEKLAFLKEEEKFKFVNVMREDYSFARKLESESEFEISFYDCLHIALCKRLNSILITRDSKLIAFAKEYIPVEMPESLLP
jgi:predicted nucleic acid-binding protein